jgi:hypothetical protein
MLLNAMIVIVVQMMNVSNAVVYITFKKLNQFLTVCKGHHNIG